MLLLESLFGVIELFHDSFVFLFVYGGLHAIVLVHGGPVHVQCAAVQQLHLHSLISRMEVFVAMLKKIGKNKNINNYINYLLGKALLFIQVVLNQSIKFFRQLSQNRTTDFGCFVSNIRYQTVFCFGGN